MCSFLVTSKKNFDVKSSNYFLQLRGPDLTSSAEDRDFFYLHNLLSITGDITRQPISNDSVTLVYNGEVYNYLDFGNYQSDGLCILDLFEKFGPKSFQMLDGEFAIVLNDKRNKKLYLCTDTFGTKPIFYSTSRNEFGASSYQSALSSLGFDQIVKCKPNQITVIDQATLTVCEEIPLYTFDLSQHKNTYEDWDSAFVESVKKRTRGLRHKLVVPMSSGHDSGLICCILNEMNTDYVSISIRGKENQDVLNRRFELKNGIKYIYDSISREEIERIKSSFQQKVERFFYGPQPGTNIQDGFNDQGAIGLYFVLKEAKEKNGCKVILSGQGSDEMMTTIKEYGFQTRNPIPFPEILSEVFPWGNFYYGSQSSYLMKEECVAGSLGMETRYPFLDRSVVQEFLHLDSKLKNAKYKAPIEFSFLKRNYPFYEGKMGFNIGL